MSIPGFGPIAASAMAATIQDTSSFAGPREFAAFLGLTPKQNSSGGKPKLGRISKMGNRLSAQTACRGAHAVLFHRKPHTDPLRMWAKKLIDKRPFKLVAVALANKMARIVFAILRGKTVYPRLSGMRQEEATAEPLPRHPSPFIGSHHPQLPRVLIAREATMASVASEMQLSSIISNLARAVSGMTSVVLNAVAVEKARNR